MEKDYIDGRKDFKLSKNYSSESKSLERLIKESPYKTVSRKGDEEP